MGSWVNLRTLGAKGDGLTDDTRAIQEAINKYPNIYVPQGSYRVSQTLMLKPSTVLIGFHPMATNFTLIENSAAFGSFGAPEALIEAPRGGTNIITGIGLYTAQNNYRAVACKWMAGEKSMINDVKFIGGHGTMTPGPKVPWKWEENKPPQGMSVSLASEQVWDTQYWSLWVTNNGGGIFKNIWSASTFAVSAFMLQIQVPAAGFMPCRWNIMSGMRYVLIMFQTGTYMPFSLRRRTVKVQNASLLSLKNVPI
jgi:hypothetical protein